MRTELQTPSPAMTQAASQAKWTGRELNQILANNLVPNGDGAIMVVIGGHLGKLTALQWECELYIGRSKASCYRWIWMAIAFESRTRR